MTDTCARSCAARGGIPSRLPAQCTLLPASLRQSVFVLPSLRSLYPSLYSCFDPLTCPSICSSLYDVRQSRVTAVNKLSYTSSVGCRPLRSRGCRPDRPQQKPRMLRPLCHLSLPTTDYVPWYTFCLFPLILPVAIAQRIKWLRFSSPTCKLKA